ncbi:hypothetical protein EVAR_29221_1 [Eumeta japonica]|uniref:Uncharacterized protein n=1 Tax=Eumeta variegata TaxID=151549 RepID=A0A4C1V5H4_EUMVA|nr:hypothetical protein EVAR_23878_1 [Eumeta japonica]GBP38277.1 hypothetical protein EVAR_29221_1 [Eumeta japonica]
MLVRDPINKSIAKQTQEINGVLITPVDTIKYLGTYLTSELCRRDTIKARCKQAIRNAKGLIPFIKKTKMHWKIAKLIYKMFLAKGCTNTGWLYKLPSLLIQNRIYTPPDIYAPFGVSGLVPFSHCDWLKVER